MQESYWGYWLVILGVFITVVMMMIQSITTSNSQDYYQLKEITESAMTDSVDYAYYRLYGEVKINKEKFVENFLRRFSETVNITSSYQVDFYDLYEAPPKVSVKVTSLANSFNIIGDETTFDIVNKLDAIIETNVIDNGDECWYYGDDNNLIKNENDTSSGSGSGNSVKNKIPDSNELKEFILNYGKSKGYYTYDGEKTTIGNMKAFVCSDYSSTYKLNFNSDELEDCNKILDLIYDSLPNNI